MSSAVFYNNLIKIPINTNINAYKCLRIYICRYTHVRIHRDTSPCVSVCVCIECWKDTYEKSLAFSSH